MYTTLCLAADVMFSPSVSISHPDKKVSSPSIASDSNGRIYIAWAREDADGVNIYVAAGTDLKSVPSASAVRVNPRGMGMNGVHANPEIAVGVNNELYVLWSSPRNRGSNILLSRSINGGLRFQKPVIVNDDKSTASRGFENMTVGKDGAIHVVWFDGRALGTDFKSVPSNSKFTRIAASYPLILAHSKKAGTTGTYYARSIDGGKTFEKNIKLDEDTCPCCRAAITSDIQGNVYASWRKVFRPVPADLPSNGSIGGIKQGGDIRDMVVAASKDNGRTFSVPAIVSEDKWAIAGCPHRGSSLGTAQNGFLYITWYTEGAEGVPSVYFAFSNDNAKTFSKRMQVNSLGQPSRLSGFPDHPKLAVNREGKVFFIWEETTPVYSRIFFRYLDGETLSEPVQINDGVRKSHDPVVAIDRDDNILIAWSYEEIRFTKTVVKIGSIENSKIKMQNAK
ncbi:MAG: exo-alpha-sialidase [Deltaproteobacteria bacterium]|nr:exo-alpha-sialidase [Deltaproteobacteria bacterium]